MKWCTELPKLSKREIECLKWAAHDKSVKETSKLLCLSPETVKKYRENAMNKVGLQTITGAVYFVVKSGLLD